MTSREMIAKFNLLNRRWIVKRYHGTLYFHAPITQVGMVELQKYYGDHYQFIIDYFEGEQGNWHWPYQDFIRIRDTFIAKVSKNRKYLTTLVKDWEKRLVEFDRVEARIEKSDLSKFSDQDLFELYEQEELAYIREFSISISLQDPFSMTAEEFLLPRLEQILRSKSNPIRIQENLQLLMTPAKLSFTAKEEIDRLQIRLDIKDIKNLTIWEEKLLEEHARKYSWLRNNYAVARKLDIKFFLNEIKNISREEAQKQQRNILNKQEAVARSKKKLLNELKLDKKTRDLVEITDVFSYMQDDRKKYSLKAIALEHTFLIEFSKRLKLNYDDAKWLYFAEIKKALLGGEKINRRILQERKKFCVSVATVKNTLEVIQGSEAKRFIDTVFPAKLEQAKEVRGTIASQGKIKGRVKIILVASELPKMRQGDVLVSTMTRPEMVTAMRKASAIVTDEGGITSHAAIISRELGTPCIIGTKIATKVFKDGDLVEVDANKGIVKLLKRKK